MQCFYMKTSPHEGLQKKVHRLTISVPVSEAGKLRRALGLPQAGDIRVTPNFVGNGVVLKPDPSGYKFSVACSSKRLQVSFTEHTYPKVATLQDAATCEVENKAFPDGLFVAHPTDPKKPKQVHKRNGKRKKAPSEPAREKTVSVLMKLPERTVIFNLPAGEAIDLALDWAAYREK
jgi:hypothetical protein